MGPSPTTTAVSQAGREWQAVQQPGAAPLSQLLDEARTTNQLLKGILAVLTNGPDWQLEAYKSDALVLAERVEWLERQVADLKERA